MFGLDVFESLSNHVLPESQDDNECSSEAVLRQTNLVAQQCINQSEASSETTSPCCTPHNFLPVTMLSGAYYQLEELLSPEDQSCVALGLTEHLPRFVKLGRRVYQVVYCWNLRDDVMGVTAQQLKTYQSDMEADHLPSSALVETISSDEVSEEKPNGFEVAVVGHQSSLCFFKDLETFTTVITDLFENHVIGNYKITRSLPNTSLAISLKLHHPRINDLYLLTEESFSPPMTFQTYGMYFLNSSTAATTTKDVRIEFELIEKNIPDWERESVFTQLVTYLDQCKQFRSPPPGDYFEVSPNNLWLKGEVVHLSLNPACSIKLAVSKMYQGEKPIEIALVTKEKPAFKLPSELQPSQESLTYFS